LLKLPLSLANLTQLKTLSLTDNVIKVLPQELSHLQSVTEFDSD